MARSRTSSEYPNGRSPRDYNGEKTPRTVPPRTSTDRRERRRSSLPQYNHNGHAVTKGIHPEGESGRRGFNPIKFLVISGRSSSTLSMMVNLLWPVVPVAIALVCVYSRAFSLEYELTSHSSTSQSPNGTWPSSSPITSPCCPQPISLGSPVKNCLARCLKRPLLLYLKQLLVRLLRSFCSWYCSRHPRGIRTCMSSRPQSSVLS